MEQLTLLESAAGDYALKYGNENALTRINAFEAGAKWKEEQYARVLTLLKGIAGWAGNLSNEVLQAPTGPNDAALRGGLVCDMRDIAVEAIRIFEPEYKPLQD